MVLGEAISKLETFMDLEPCFKVHNSVVIVQNSTKLGQITNLNVVFHIVVAICKLDKIRNLNRPSALLNLRVVNQPPPPPRL